MQYDICVIGLGYIGLRTASRPRCAVSPMGTQGFPKNVWKSFAADACCSWTVSEGCGVSAGLEFVSDGYGIRTRGMLPDSRPGLRR